MDTHLTDPPEKNEFLTDLDRMDTGEADMKEEVISLDQSYSGGLPFRNAFLIRFPCQSQSHSHVSISQVPMSHSHVGSRCEAV